MRKRTWILPFAAAAVLLLLAACNDDDCPTCPGDNPAPTMENIWPHADGNAWTYESEWMEFDVDGPADELPSMIELYAGLAAAPSGDPSDTLAGLFRLELDGTYTTQTGVETQYLSETWYLVPEDEDPSKAQPVSGSASARLLGLLAATRPELRDGIDARVDLAAKSFRYLSGPVLLGGRSFAYEDSGYFGYGDLDQNHSWVFLESGLDVGTEFSLQLVSALADDIWLYGRIWSVGDLTVGGQDFQNAVECMYVIDLGESQRTGEDGGELETVRSYVYGTVHYVPGVGPVRVRERGRLSTSTAYQVHDDIVTSFDLELIGAAVAD